MSDSHIHKMFRFVALCALISVAFGAAMPDNLDGRITNGVETTIEAHPYQVSLQTTPDFHFCGGSIINEDTIVTAAHCLTKFSVGEIRVRLGSTNHTIGGELVAVRAFKIHPGFDYDTMNNDVGIVKLATPVRESSKVRYVALAKSTPKTGTPAVVAGWGAKCYMLCLTVTTLQEVEVDIVDGKVCASSEYKYGSLILESMVCAYAVKKDACSGDSGGALMAGGKMVGIVSWGHGCGWVGYPGVYTDVAKMHKWIVDTAASL